MKKHKKPLQRYFSVRISFCIIVISLLICMAMDIGYTKTVYGGIEQQMTDVLNYVNNSIDKDDLFYCYKNQVKSDSYNELNQMMSDLVDGFAITYICIIEPYSAEDYDNVKIVVAPNKAEIYGSEGRYYDLGQLTGDSYSKEVAEEFLRALNRDGITFLKNESIWGNNYTGVMPVYNSHGKAYALLCADVDVSRIYNKIFIYNLVYLIVIGLLGVIAGVLTSKWLKKNVVDPIAKLETSVTFFAEKVHNKTVPTQLVYIGPDIKTDNELEGLAKSIETMAKDMRKYASGLEAAENKVFDMKSQVTRMDLLAYQDALTHVKNKAWYDEAKKRINDDIKRGEALFGIITIDLNDLKVINAKYGHEKGNEYIFGSCHQVCEIFEHSPVFRIGGDEFVVLIEAGDYHDRLSLFDKLKNSFAFSSQDESKEPWLRYSAAIGMSVFENGDALIDDVYARAEKLMRANKKETKMI